MEQLKALHGHYRFPLPPPKHGSGKKGGIVKQDYAEALVNHFFKDKVDKADFESMVSGIMEERSNILTLLVPNVMLMTFCELLKDLRQRTNQILYL